MPLQRPLPPLIAATLSLLTITSPASGNTQLGLGLTKCAQFNAIQSQAPEIARAFDAWITGYVSGVNFIVYTTKGIDLLAQESSEKVSAFVKGYCSINPNRSLTEGANEYWFGLANRQPR